MRLHRYILLSGVSFVVPAIVGIATLLSVLFYKPSYDVTHPDYNYFVDSVRGPEGADCFAWDDK